MLTEFLTFQVQILSRDNVFFVFPLFEFQAVFECKIIYLANKGRNETKSHTDH